MAPWIRRVAWLSLAFAILVIVTAVGGGVYLRGQLRASLPVLTGSVAVAGLEAQATVDRDGLGVPTITAASRRDAARALGFVHAQDRFFQMDLQRRQAAGELSALVGVRALEVDRAARVHRFRHISRQAIAQATPAYRAILDAYAEGVNAGLASLGAPPIEYLVLRAKPEPWKPEDAILTVLAMFNTLQGRQPLFEATFGTLADTMPPSMYDFLTARGSEWDAPVTGGRFPRPAIPGTNVFDLRRNRVQIAETTPRTEVGAEDGGQRGGRRSPQRTEVSAEDQPSRPVHGLPLRLASGGQCGGPAFAAHSRAAVSAGKRRSLQRTSLRRPFTGWRFGWQAEVEGAAVADAATGWPVCLTAEEAAGLGSNNWAVSGAHTATGVALVANDMHLAINVPNIWYRASMIIPDPRASGETIRLTGLTLPGLPSLVVGSNGHVAWGFTNTGGDWSDLVVIEPDPRNPDHYLTPEGPRAIEAFDERIATLGGGTEPFTAHWTIWGPIVRRDHKGRELAQRWVAHDAAVLAGDVTSPEGARTVEEALAIAAGQGIPAQNFVAGDSAGHIGWTIAGPIPKRVGFDGSRPTSWADGSRRWDGYVARDAFPRIVDPAAGRVWTANSPVVEGDMLATIGEGGYADGIRARVIRDRLMAIEKATPADMLSVQLDHNALFHERWRTLILETMTPAAVRTDSRRAEFRQLVETTWTGKADPASVAYRLVRTFRQVVSRQVLGALTAPAKRVEPDFDYTRALRSEGPLWQLVTERPAHLLDPRHASWDAQLLAAVDTAIVELTVSGGRLADRTWGEFNRAIVAHPLASAVPLVHRWLNMPADPLPGDIYTPRAHSPRAGPSERMVVSPGRESEGILHMPTGQSGHPWSPHYGDQHGAWVTGEAVPFLPGPTVSHLVLRPRPIEN